MEELIHQARDRAYNFLYKEIEKIREKIKEQNKTILYPSKATDKALVLRLEAYSYLANKKSELNPFFADEIRNLWLQWKKNRPDSWGEFFVSAGWECDVAMIRTQEILGISGFKDDFDIVIESIKKCIWKYPLALGSWGHYYWVIFRCTSISDAIEDCIQHAALVALDDLKSYDLDDQLSYWREEEMPEEQIPEEQKEDEIASILYDWISSVLFLVLSNYNDDCFNNAVKALDKMVDLREENGSILDNVTITCLFLIAVYLTKIDRQKEIQSKTLNWLLGMQNSDGSWDHWAQGDYRFKKFPWIKRQNRSWQVLSTVRILESIDLITNDEPLPPWVLALDEPSTIHKKGSYEEREICHLDVPPGTKWNDVIIRFRGKEKIEVHVGDKFLGVKKYDELSFNKIGSEKQKKIWSHTLWLFAKAKGEVQISDVIDEHERIQLRKNISLLRKKLISIFGIDDDPFHPKKHYKPYITKFLISCLDDKDTKTEYEKLIEEDVENKELEIGEEKLRLSRYEEVKGKKQDK